MLYSHSRVLFTVRSMHVLPFLLYEQNEHMNCYISSHPLPSELSNNLSNLLAYSYPAVPTESQHSYTH